LILKIIGIALIALFSILFYNNITWKSDQKHHAYFLHELSKNKDSAQIIYIGESSNFWHSDTDSDVRSISKMIEHKTALPLLTLNKSAYHMAMYKEIFSFFEQKNNLKQVILTLNIRTFGPPCVFSNFETALQKEALFLKDEMPWIKKTKAVFNIYDNKNNLLREKEMWKIWTNETLKIKNKPLNPPTIKTWCEQEKFIDTNGKSDMPKRILADDYIKAFGFNLNANNPRIKDLDEIVKQVTKQNKYKLYLLIMSENMAWADSFAGKNLTALILENKNYILNRYKGIRGVHIIDNLNTVNPDYFGEKDWTTEHYFWQGRAQMANKIVAELKL